MGIWGEKGYWNIVLNHYIVFKSRYDTMIWYDMIEGYSNIQIVLMGSCLSSHNTLFDQVSYRQHYNIRIWGIPPVDTRTTRLIFVVQIVRQYANPPPFRVRWYGVKNKTITKINNFRTTFVVVTIATKVRQQ